MSDTILTVPAFARISDYIGLWCLADEAATLLRQLALSMDLRGHVEQGAEPLRAALEKTTGPAGKSIAVIKLTGILMKSQSSMGGTSTIQARRDLRQAVSDPDTAGILLAIDSPGGTVAGTSDLAEEVKAAGKVKAVWAHIDDLGASAAYWVASQASRIVANSGTALVGSIGTIQTMTDYSAAAEKAGLKTLVFATGPMKGLGTPGSKITDEQIAHVQALVDGVQKHFDTAVMRGRGLSAKELAAVRHGGVFTAEAALESRLIDAIQPLGKTLAEFSRSLAEPKAARAALRTLPMLAGRSI